MKNLRITVFLIIFTFIFNSIPYSLQAVSTTSTITGVTQEKSTIGEKITSLFTKFKSKIRKALNSNKGKVSFFWFWAGLLILAGIIMGVVIVFYAFAVAITSTSASAGAIVSLLLILGVFLPIFSLFFAFRPLLRNHFKKIDKDISKRKINIYALLLSLVPGALSLIWLLLGLIA